MTETPMLRQYRQVKEQHPDKLVFFRLGDFYELFAEDARRAAGILDITLTARYKGKPNELPMCGVPVRSVDGYISKLIKAGLKVVVVDQISAAVEGQLVERGVVQVVTSGTSLSDQSLVQHKNQYLVSIDLAAKHFGLAFADLSTGEFKLTEVYSWSELKSFLAKIDPAEVLVKSHKLELKLAELDPKLKLTLFKGKVDQFDLKKQFVDSDWLVLDKFASGQLAAANLWAYLEATQLRLVDHFTLIELYDQNQYLVLDNVTIKNLELVTNNYDYTKTNTLLSVLDHCQTSFGSRLLRRWLLHPLRDEKLINQRLDLVASLVAKPLVLNNLKSILSQFIDLERVLAKISLDRHGFLDLIGLRKSLALIPQLNLELSQLEFEAELDPAPQIQIDPQQSLVDFLGQVLNFELETEIDNQNFIKMGFNKDYDHWRQIIKNNQQWLAELQQKEIVSTGISSLKVRYTKAFGYYLEVSKSNLAKVPAHYQRKQTLVNHERFITPELKEYEEKMLLAEESLQELERKILVEVSAKVMAEVASLQRTALEIARVDCLFSLAEVALQFDYQRPELITEGDLVIKGGRHPVIEQLINQAYVPNDLSLKSDQYFLLLTGPNMSGKSSYLRQNALLIIMAHIGSFVPVQSAQIPLTDRVFTRVGAHDNLSQGQSTFMVEMQEVANILKFATKASFVIIDELGRGTSTYDGLSLAWAVAEYLHHKLAAKTILATHYHELISLADELPGALNASVSVSAEGDQIIFLHQVVVGGTSRSYGLEVAKLAGVPLEIIERAKERLISLEG